MLLSDIRFIFLTKIFFYPRITFLQNANERRQKLLAVLSIRRHDIVENLAYEFSISKKTILRDVNLLSLEHNPVYTLPGRNGGIFMVDGCYSGSNYLTAAEKELLIRLLDFLEDEDKIIMRRIIKTFSLPNKDT
jgi:predicted DNA-binding transcriptional regulator YafY